MKKRNFISTFCFMLLGTILLLSGCGNSYKTNISLPSGTYQGEQIVELSTENGDDSCTIYYTLDGSNPTSTDGYEYDPDKKLHINYSSTLKAVTYSHGHRGRVATAEYEITDETAQENQQEEEEQKQTEMLQELTGDYVSTDGSDFVSIDASTSLMTWRIGDENGDQRDVTLSDLSDDSTSCTLTTSDNDGNEKVFKVKVDNSSSTTVYTFNDESFQKE